MLYFSDSAHTAAPQALTGTLIHEIRAVPLEWMRPQEHLDYKPISVKSEDALFKPRRSAES